ncbi:MAG TPA: MBL fold metallo-hydrolase [Herpetosiphon sp.]|uniref:Beta-lactamase domain protein n=1 Tax=Herpetosiphon aurantiacus (strain ATCC 23779 / DSM 785 / 114-95) TaxID=316274 RepID=A9B1W7_HERA2|nr:beta-lactamase domain protein [Herpetosiphon aurantiacus DSM 785]HBW48952.1 MBL fold metallo-hydrolase [Herpetosiphon sp.]
MTAPSFPAFCNRCGNRRSPQARFCRYCGNAFQHWQATATKSIPSTEVGVKAVQRSIKWRYWFALTLVLFIGARLSLKPLMGLVLGGLNFSNAPIAGTPNQSPPNQRLATGQTLRIHVIDVDQGDSILIQTPQGMNALIDGGYDNGLALEYLHQQGIQRIDHMIVSHPHADHIGGLVEVLNSLEVGSIWTSGAVHSTSYFENLLDAIDRQQVPYREVKTQESIPLGDLSLLVVRSEPQAGDLNDTSLILRLEYGQFSMLFTGDAEASSEVDVLQTTPNLLPATVLKVGHHGSYTSTTPAFALAVDPTLAIYSAGRNNSYGHPHQQTLTTLCNLGATVYGTDRHGTVVITSDGLEYQVQTAQRTTALCH